MGTPADRLAELLQFGPRKNKNAGGGSAYPPRSGGAKLPGGLIGFAIAAILILWLIASSYYTVQPEERAVVKRFGAVVKTADPGLHFKLPFGVDTVEFVATERVLKQEFGFRTLSTDGERSEYAPEDFPDESLMLSGDLNIIDVEWVVQYRISDPMKFLYGMRDPTRTLRDISESVMRRVVGNRLGSDVLTTARVEIGELAEREIQEAMKQYDNGIHIVTVQLQDVVPPRAVQPAFNEVNEARQERERMINEATKRLNQEIPKASGEANRLIAEAEGLCQRAREPGARRNRRLPFHPDRIPQRPGSDARTHVHRDDPQRVADGRHGHGGEGRQDRPVAVLRPAQAACRRRDPGAAAMKSTLALIVGVLVALGLLQSTYVIDQSEQAIVVQFGEPVGELVDTPGLHWKLPFIQDVRRFDKRILSWDGDVTQIPTLGREFVVVDTTARWRIVDPLKFLRSVRDEAGAKTRLDDLVDSVSRDIISGTTLEEIIRSKDWAVDAKALGDEVAAIEQVDLTKPKKGRAQLEKEMLAAASKLMPELGIALVDVRLKRINYIDSVSRQVETRMISERQSIAERFRSEGQGKSSEILGQMERELRQIRSEAERKAAEIRGKADAEATKIYGDSYGADPEFFAFLRTLDSYKAMGENTTLVLDADSEFFRYLDSTRAR
jgi:membrane protease subunit HflC